MKPQEVAGEPEAVPEIPVPSGEDALSPPASLSARQQFVQASALFLFDRTAAMHELGESGRDLLAQAAMLFDQSFPKGKKPVRAARKLVSDCLASVGLTEEHLRVLAAIKALQHKKIKRGDLEKFGLSPMQQREVLTLAALLIIAVGLDQSNTQSTTITQVEPVRGGLWMVVDGLEAAKDASAAHHGAQFWAKIGYPELRFMEMNQARAKVLPYPESRTTIGMNPDDSYAEAGRKVMLYHFAEMLRNEPGTRLGEDIEALHDMRVATRRLRAAFEVFAPAFDPEALKPHLRGLRNTGRTLGRVRDLDVMLDKAQVYRKSLAEPEQRSLDILLTDWNEQRDRDRAHLLAFLDSEEYQTFKRKFNVFVNTPGMGVLPFNRDEPVPDLVKEIAPVLVYTRLGHVRAYAPYLPGAPIERLHALRIEFKLFRYTVEFFREVFCGNVKEVIDLLKKVQDHLGDLNDADVVRIVLQEYLAKLRAQAAEGAETDLSGIDAYCTFRVNERDSLVASFSDVWAGFDRVAVRQMIAECVSIL
jgi:CHAD domain-containing protein